MALSKQQFSHYIKQFQFRELFNDIGWDNDKTQQPIVIDNETYYLQAVAQKSGFRILILQAVTIPDYATRKKIETQVTKFFHEHLIIFFDAQKNEQIWQLAVRQAGKPTKLTETRWNKAQTPELLYQRAAGVFFEMNEEEHITIIDVTRRMAENFQQNNERVTKAFYDRFKKEHTAFLQFITGIAERTNQEWYASLMLNRLMFCYFIQKRGFLDNNKNYLRNKLNECKQKQGNGKFYSFYRSFLLVLFHKGLNNPVRTDEMQVEIGKIPYLNGGLFDEHEIEKSHSDIDIDDKAFENLFNFFDQYEWHLDTRNTASGKDINPDVIGYIFEKYINERAAMGAYYTKEDITDYIGKNCIIPYLLDETARNNHSNHENLIKIMVQTSADRYIYDAVKKGVELPLPPEIETGIDPALPNLRERRKEWNKPAEAEYALPTEIWRETVARRQRYTEVCAKIDNGEIQTINDFITYNLNIRQFAQDVIENTNDSEFLKTFYKALTTVTILDPTCGSGAFLFAAMNILEPLYEACIMRMHAFVEDEDRANTENKKNFSHKYKFFREVLENIQSPQHPNLSYFVYKNIILNNLYGVDIMKEAVEIAKLRLFLKLVATVEPDYRKPNLGLEPLPDIDFNIRAGNTLVGFATENELENAFIGALDFDNDKEKTKEKCEIVAMAFQRYKEIQLTHGENFEQFKHAKEDLNNRLKSLNHELNLLLHKQYVAIPYDRWLFTHQPFHWFAEFYEIINKGGFDVIIGNPPYVEYSVAKFEYKIKNYETEKCSNLYGYVIERSNNILNKKGLMGMIVPISAFSNASMLSLQKYFKNFSKTYISNFHQRPAALFEGVLQRLSIFLCVKEAREKEVHSTMVYRWKVETRNNLFSNLFYAKCDQSMQDNSLKVGAYIENGILDKYFKHKQIKLLVSQTKTINNNIYYRTAGGGYWVPILNTPFATNSLSNKSNSFQIEANSKVISAVLNSNLFWWYYTINYDQFNFKDYMIFGFRFNYPQSENIENLLIELSDKLEIELLNNATTYIINSKTRGSNETITYNKILSKSTMDKIDYVLAEHYGFTEEELDFIINYDIKYRMGKGLEGADE
jgi:tRNA1(Val) A37 N6-methylase TrmN6